MIDGKPLILGRPPLEGGLAYLRCEQPLVVMGRKGLAITPVLSKDDDPDLAWKAKVQADCFHSCAWPLTGQYGLIEEWCDRGKPWVWDIDDDPTNISPFNHAYRAYGQEEVQLADGTWLWKDGTDNFSLDSNRKRQVAFEALIKDHVTAITTTTPYLAEKLIALYDKPVYIRPNVLDFQDIWTHRNRINKDGLVRIIYEGGSSHARDLFSVLPVLADIEKAYPHVRFVFQGGTKEQATVYLPEEKIEEFGWSTDYGMFAYRFAQIGANIAIAPLSQDEHSKEFNSCKSPLKWLDAAALGIPCVCQNATPFKEVLNFGRAADSQWNGILAGTEEEWFAALSALIQSADMRNVIGNNAQREAWEHWDADDFAEEYLSQYMEVLANGDCGDCDTQDVANAACASSRS